MRTKSSRKSLRRHVRNRLLSGLLVLIPLWITVVILGAVFKAMGAFLRPLVKLLPWSLPESAVRVISIGACILVIYLVGLITTHMVGRRLVALGESLIMRVPLVKTVYAASKQIVDALSFSRRTAAVMAIVLVEYPRPGLKVIGFMTGVIWDGQGRKYCKVFIPTAPNPTSGFLELVPWEQVEKTDLSVEDGVKLIVSGGMIGPDKIKTHPLSDEV